MTMHAQDTNDSKITTIDLITENDPEGKYYAVADLQIIVRPTHVMFNGDMETLTAIHESRAFGPGERLSYEVPPALVSRVHNNPNATATFFVETLSPNPEWLQPTPALVASLSGPVGVSPPAPPCPSCGHKHEVKSLLPPPHRSPLAAKIEQAQRPASVLIAPHAVAIVSCSPPGPCRVVGLDVEMTYLCGVCQGEGIVGATSAFRVTCPACAGAKTASLSAQPVQPATVLVNDLRVGRDSQLNSVGSVPVTAFKRGFVRTDVAMPGMWITLSFDNPSNQPVRISGKVHLEAVASPFAANVPAGYPPVGGLTRVMGDMQMAIGQKAVLVEQYPTEEHVHRISAVDPSNGAA